MVSASAGFEPRRWTRVAACDTTTVKKEEKKKGKEKKKLSLIAGLQEKKKEGLFEVIDLFILFLFTKRIFQI